MKKNDSRKRGGLFERAAAKEYEKKGYKILGFNYSAKGGEIDVIAGKKELLVFVEVKARKTGSSSNPFEAVDSRKQKRIIRAAKQYMLFNNLYKTYVRFDVAAVEAAGDEAVKIEIMEDAFQDAGV
ncbi:MAG: YraN family protein [Candidatus Goldiibacteriota bacterium]